MHALTTVGTCLIMSESCLSCEHVCVCLHLYKDLVSIEPLDILHVC